MYRPNLSRNDPNRRSGSLSYGISPRPPASGIYYQDIRKVRSASRLEFPKTVYDSDSRYSDYFFLRSCWRCFLSMYSSYRSRASATVCLSKAIFPILGIRASICEARRFRYAVGREGLRRRGSGKQATRSADCRCVRRNAAGRTNVVRQPRHHICLHPSRPRSDRPP